MKSRYNLNRLGYFVATVEEGTITAAAERLGLSKAVVSKHLQLLEQEVGVNLLLRNTRKMQPTQVGQDFYEKSKAILIRADEAFDSVMERGHVPAGRMRITAPVDYGVSHVAPLVARYCAQYPRVEIDLVLSDEQVDLIEQRFDLAFRIGWLKDSSNLARKLRSFNEIVVCAPSLLKQHKITAPEDLVDLPFVANRALTNATRWQFQRGKAVRNIEMTAAITMNITLGIRNAVMTGSCFTVLPDFLVAEDLDKKKMVTLLPDWTLRSGGVYVVSPPSRLRTSAVEKFLEMAR